MYLTLTAFKGVIYVHICKRKVMVKKKQMQTHQLVGDIGVVLTGHALTDGGLHQTRQRWQHVDWRVDLPVMQLTVDVNLSREHINVYIIRKTSI